MAHVLLLSHVSLNKPLRSLILRFFWYRSVQFGLPCACWWSRARPFLEVYENQTALAFASKSLSWSTMSGPFGGPQAWSHVLGVWYTTFVCLSVSHGAVQTLPHSSRNTRCNLYQTLLSTLKRVYGPSLSAVESKIAVPYWQCMWLGASKEKTGEVLLGLTWTSSLANPIRCSL